MWHHDPCRTKTPLQPLGGRVAPRTFKLPLTAVHDNLSNVSRQSIARPFLQRISSSAPCFATEDAAQGAQKSALPTQHCQTVSVPAPPADPTHKNQWGSFRLFQLLWVSEIVVMTFAPEVKATRAAPAPVNQKKHPHKHRHSSSSPFDPEELSRKLTIIQAEQRVLAEQTRIARIETEHKATTQRSKERRVEKKHYDLAHEFPQPDKKKSLPAHVGVKSTPDQCQDESALDNTGVGLDASCMNHAPGVRNGDDGCSPTYRHIPQVAALQFARTTTIDPPGEKGLVHRLSKMALKYHMDGVNADTGFQDESHTIAPYEAAKTLKKAQRKREKQYQRNQFQHPSTLLPTVGINDNVIHPVQPTLFETDSSPKSLDSDDEEGAAGMTMEKVASAPHAEKHESPHHEGLTEAEIAEHRVDWTQSDEIKLRKSESRWRLKRHLGGHKHRDYPAILPEEKEPTMEDVTKSRIAALLPRLRRHSAGDLL
ncbi:unnamed protein product [Clonostachys rosea f. rosea IK726]|uniref:Uncharacterized protein n=1 Tax=Clonostachys rosea f. rosea IK726 TaxID=1349383 RepID=A0ACA9TDI1_BIOOC|nr:unnamed protein product [Clonostachys rosea f. rosea IK726]